MVWFRKPLLLLGLFAGLLFFLAVGIALRPIGLRKRARAQIEELGGRHSTGEYRPSWYWDTLMHWHGDLRIWEIQFDGPTITEHDLSFLREIREVGSLHLRYVDVSDEFLAQICSGLGEDVWELDFKGTRAGDKTARAILDNKNLDQLDPVNLLNTQVSAKLARELEVRGYDVTWGAALSEETLKQVQDLWPAAELTHHLNDDQSQVRGLTVWPSRVKRSQIEKIRAIEGEIGLLGLKWAGDISPELQEALTHQKTVRSLWVSSRQIDATWFRQFQGLETISISGCSIVWTPPEEPLLSATVQRVGFSKMWWMSDGGIGKLLQGSSVTHLDGGKQETKYPIKDEHLAGLGDLPLQELRLENSAITDAGLAELARLNELRVLDLGGVQVTSEGLPLIGSLSSLEILHLDRTAVTDKNLDSLANLDHLRILSLDSTAVTDAGIRHLTKLTQLESLTLAVTMVSPAALSELLAMPNLRQLALSKSGVSKADWLAIAKSHPSWAESDKNKARKRAHYPKLLLERTN